MSGRYLLDTNFVIDLFRSKKDLTDLFEKDARGFVPTTVVGELYYGAYNSKRVQENLARIASFILKTKVLNSDTETSRLYGQIKASMKKQGTPLPENDMWIAAFAMRHELTLISKDSHFDKISELVVKGW